MSASYQELKQQSEKLLAEVEKARKKEVQEFIGEVRSKMEFYGLTIQDMGFSTNTRLVSKSDPSQSIIKYKSPDGQGWTGGRGRKPDWVMKALAEGKSLEDFAV